MKIVCFSNFTLFQSPMGVRIPLVANMLEKLQERGHDVRYAVVAGFISSSTTVPAIELPGEVFTQSGLWRAWSREALRARGVPGLPRRPPWVEAVREFAPDLAIGMNGPGVAVAGVAHQVARSRVLTMNIGGWGWRHALDAPFAVYPLFFQHFLPHRLHLDGLLAIDDTTHVYAGTRAARLPAARQCYLPIPHRRWRQWEPGSLERFGLPPRTGAKRVVWAANPTPSKRPMVFLETARALSRLGLDLDMIMVSGAKGSMEAAIGDDPALRAQFTHLPSMPNESLEVLFESADLAVFTPVLSVAGTIFRETVDAGVAVAATVDPVDSLLINMLDTTRDILTIDAHDPQASARSIAEALADPARLEAQAKRAQQKMRTRGLLMDDYLERVVPFIEKIGAMPVL